MRYSSDHKEGARARLVDATGALVKKNGFAATGVDGLMAAAGLTSGAFYSHFRSKGALLEAIIENELKRSIALFSNNSPEQAVAVVESYLGQEHIAHPESGCAVPALTPEVSRSDESTKRVFESGILALKEQIKGLVKEDAKAWSVMAQLVGAVMIARGMASEQTRSALLEGVAQQVKQVLEESSRTS